MTYGELKKIVDNHPGKIEVYIPHLGHTRVYRGDLLLNLGSAVQDDECGTDLARILDNNDGYLTIN